MKTNFFKVSCLTLVGSLLFMLNSCDTETIVVDENTNSDVNLSAEQRAPAPKIDVCHYSVTDDKWLLINVSENAWADHVLHGDVRLDDQDGDGFVPDNECGIGPMGDCDDNDYNINPGVAEICGDGIDNNCDGQVDEDCLCETNCSYADLDLYGPYTDFLLLEDYNGPGKPVLLLYYGDDGIIQIGFSLNILNEWEFVVFPTVYSCDLDTQFGLSCDDPNVCPYFMSISEEGALCLIDQALALNLTSRSSSTNDSTADYGPKKIIKE